MSEAEILINPTTAAVVSKVLFVSNGEVIPVTANGLGATETIAIEVYSAADTWITYKIGGISVGLTANDNKIGIDIPGRYRLNKPVTLAAVGVLRDIA